MISNRNSTLAVDIERPAPPIVEVAPGPVRGAIETPPVEESSTYQVLRVGKGISLYQAAIISCKLVVVAGRLEAARLSDSRKMEILVGGYFEGVADIDDAEISGQFEGKLLVRRQLVIRGTGIIRGMIRYGKLTVETGGRVSGSLGTAAAAEVRPSNDKHDPAQMRQRLESIMGEAGTEAIAHHLAADRRVPVWSDDGAIRYLMPSKDG